MIFFIMPYIMIPFAFIAYYFYIINIKYLSSAQSYKRVTSNLRSPVLSIISEATNGSTVIRAFKK